MRRRGRAGGAMRAAAAPPRPRGTASPRVGGGARRWRRLPRTRTLALLGASLARRCTHAAAQLLTRCACNATAAVALAALVFLRAPPRLSDEDAQSTRGVDTSASDDALPPKVRSLLA